MPGARTLQAVGGGKRVGEQQRFHAGAPGAVGCGGEFNRVFAEERRSRLQTGGLCAGEGLIPTGGIFEKGLIGEERSISRGCGDGMLGGKKARRQAAGKTGIGHRRRPWSGWEGRSGSD